MKKWIGLLLVLVIACAVSAALADVDINETNFPDAAFRTCVSSFDKNNDQILSPAELADAKVLDCSGLGIATLDGIEHFTALETLDCSSNKLTTLSLLKNGSLLKLDCAYNYLTSLDVSANTQLIELECVNNRLTALDTSKNTALLRLYCRFNQLSALDLSNNHSLMILYCYNNKISTLDLSKNTALQCLDCSSNRLTALDLSNNPYLTEVYCNINKISALDVSRNTALQQLFCNGNLFTRLDVTYCKGLSEMVQNCPRQTDAEHNTDFFERDLSKGEFRILQISRNVTVTAGNFISEPTSPKDLKNATIGKIAAQVYTGSAIKPALTVKYKDQVLVSGTDYTVSYADNKKVGIATATVKGIGDYTGEISAEFRINPAAVKLSALTAGKGELTVTWEKGSGIDGYELEYSVNKDFSKARKITVSKASTVKYVIEKLKAKTTYYVRIRAIKTVGGKKYVSEWSKAMKKKVK